MLTSKRDTLLNGTLTTEIFVDNEWKLHSFGDNPAKIDANGSKYWYKNGLMHRANELPAYQNPDGSYEYRVDGKLHRDSGKPAQSNGAGTLQYYCVNGEYHRDGDKPAIVDNDTKIYYRFGKKHRDGDLPAHISPNLMIYYKNDLIHRDGDEPAFVTGSGEKIFYRDGKKHRDGGRPAHISDKFNIYYRDGVPHRDSDEPAYVSEACLIKFVNGLLHGSDGNPAVTMMNPVDVKIDDIIVSATRMSWYKNGVLHRDNDLPAVIRDDEVLYYFEGELHRIGDMPAVEKRDYKAWYNHGKIGREYERPAVISIKAGSVCMEYYTKGVLNRVSKNLLTRLDEHNASYYDDGQLREEKAHNLKNVPSYVFNVFRRNGLAQIMPQ